MAHLFLQRCLFVSLLVAYVAAQKPIVKPPKGKYKSVLAMEGGGMRTLISVMVLVEVEESIKRHFKQRPDLLPKGVGRDDDFEVELVDYFDLMSGNSAGAWIASILATRGGKGLTRRVLNDPQIVEKYGIIPTGSARALIVFFKEYGFRMFPRSAYDFSAGRPFNISNQDSTGVSMPVYELERIEMAVGDFVGNLTMADLETSVLISAFDLIEEVAVLFVQNAFNDVPEPALGRMFAAAGPKRGGIFEPDLTFSKANYYLTDVCSASSALPIFLSAKPISSIGQNTADMVAVDGGISFEAISLMATFFAAGESGFKGLESVAVMSVGSGLATRDFTPLVNEGLNGWANGLSIVSLFLRAGLSSKESLLDFLFYSNPETKPYQYLRIQIVEPAATERGQALSFLDQAAFVDVYEAIGIELSETYRKDISVFVRDFLFG